MGPGGGMVDAPDLKSGEVHPSCQFKSGSGQFFINRFLKRFFYCLNLILVFAEMKQLNLLVAGFASRR